DFVRSCDANAPIEAEYKVYMRYRGQGWEIPISLTPEQAANPDMETYKALFEADYTQLFGRPVAGLEIVATVWAVNATTPTPPVERLVGLSGGAAASASGSRAVFDAAKGETVDAQVIERADFAPGTLAAGPSIVVEDETTIIVPSSRQATVQTDGCVDLVKKG
ncbi:MAG: hydantoinase/oxoprolinase family protein, partial [Alphaproteobacteria bacterium]